MDVSQKKRSFLPIILIIVLGLAVYSSALKGAFIWDDEHLVENNASIRTWSDIPQVFTQDIGDGAGGRKYSFYRPVQMLSYKLDHSFWKLNPLGYHLTNIILHILVALCLYGMVRTLFGDAFLAGLVGILYVVHPVHTEAVTYIAGRADSLSLLFMLTCFHFYIRSLSSRKLGDHILVVLCYALALLSKEHSLILPALLALYHFSFKKKVDSKVFLSVVGLAVFYIVLRMTALKSLTPGEVYNTTLADRLPGFFVAFFSYIKLLLFPFDLHMEYGRTLFTWSDPKAALGLALFIGIMVFLFTRKRKNALVFFAIGWYLLALFPVSNLYAINAYMAEHWLYLPSVGFFLLVAKGISVLHDQKDMKPVALLLMAGLTIFYGTLTFRQNEYWREPLGFFKRTLIYAPESPAIHYNLGNIYVDKKQLNEAVSAYKQAIKLKPRYDEAYNNLGNVYSDIGRVNEAIGFYQEAIEITPDFIDAHYNLGNAYDQLGQREEAVRVYKQAIKIDPGYVQAHNNLGVAYAALNQIDEAIASYKKAIELDPNHANAYFSLGNVYRAMGRWKEAAAAYKKAVELNPADAEAHQYLLDVTQRLQ